MKSESGTGRSLRVVLDTVAFVRAFINPQGSYARILTLSRSLFILVTSPEIVAETLEVLGRSSLRDRFAQITDDAVVDLKTILAAASYAVTEERIDACRDPDDNKVLECAAAASADYIVTGDKDLRDLDEFRHIKIRYADEFLREFGHSADSI